MSQDFSYKTQIYIDPIKKEEEDVRIYTERKKQ